MLDNILLTTSTITCADQKYQYQLITHYFKVGDNRFKAVVSTTERFTNDGREPYKKCARLEMWTNQGWKEVVQIDDETAVMLNKRHLDIVVDFANCFN